MKELDNLKSAYIHSITEIPVTLHTTVSCTDELNRLISKQALLIDNLKKCLKTLAAFIELHNLCANALMSKISSQDFTVSMDSLFKNLPIQEFPLEENRADNKGSNGMWGEFTNLLKLLRSSRVFDLKGQTIENKRIKSI